MAGEEQRRRLIIVRKRLREISQSQSLEHNIFGSFDYSVVALGEL